MTEKYSLKTTGRLGEQEVKSFQKRHDDTAGIDGPASARKESHNPSSFSDHAARKGLPSDLAIKSHSSDLFIPCRDTLSSNGVEYVMLSEVVGELHPSTYKSRWGPGSPLIHV